MKAYIVLATFNGERWLAEQLESLLAQSESDWILLARDDGSTDATTKILDDYAARDSRITTIANEPGTSALGAAGNFGVLLHHVQTINRDQTPVFLCDQDDCWEAAKIESQIADLATSPASCHDVEYMDEGGQRSGRQMLQGLGLPIPTMGSLLAQNSVIGCTLAIRPEVLELAMPFPPALINHDWWLGLCASCVGEISFSSAARVKYRQHANNVVGGYRPIRQLGRLPSLYRRQRLVLRSQITAVAVLQQRLRERQQQVPEVLSEYLASVGSLRVAERVAALFRGQFAAESVPLRSLRSVAALRQL